MMQEKGAGNDRLPPPGSAITARHNSPFPALKSSGSAFKKVTLLAVLGSLFFIARLFWIPTDVTFFGLEADSDYAADLCPQTAPLVPEKHVALWEELGELLMHTYFKSQAILWLSDAVRTPCVTLF